MLRTCGKARRFSPSIATLPAAAYSQVCWTGATSVSEEHAPVLGIMRLACCSLSEIRSPAKNAERQDFMSRGLNQRYLSACLYRILGHAETLLYRSFCQQSLHPESLGHTVRHTHTVKPFCFFNAVFGETFFASAGQKRRGLGSSAVVGRCERLPVGSPLKVHNLGKS